MPILEKICEEVSRFDRILFVCINFLPLGSDCLITCEGHRSAYTGPITRSSLASLFETQSRFRCFLGCVNTYLYYGVIIFRIGHCSREDAQGFSTLADKLSHGKISRVHLTEW